MQCLQAASDGLRCACGILCLFIIGGPVLIIAGIVLLVLDNPREGKVKEFNEAVDAYVPITTWTGTIDSRKVTTRPVQLRPSGNDDDVKKVESYFASATVPRNTTNVQYDINNIWSFTVTPSYTVTRSGTVTCNANRYGSCSSSEALNYCRNKYGSTATTSGSCSRTCSCRYTVRLRTYCVAGETTSPNVRISCYYPFADNSQDYADADSSSNVEFQMRSRDDPFLVMQRVTEGSMDFGLTKKQQRIIAFVCLGIGAFIILCDVLVGFFLYKAISAAWKRRQNNSAPGGGGGAYQSGLPYGGGYPSPQPYAQAPAYPAPQGPNKADLQWATPAGEAPYGGGSPNGSPLTAAPYGAQPAAPYGAQPAAPYGAPPAPSAPVYGVTPGY